MTFTVEDLETLTDRVADAWRVGLDRDWTQRAGTLDWSCRQTADHAVDTVFAAAIFLASRKQDGYPEYGLSTPGSDATPQVLIEALRTATVVLSAVVRTSEPGATAVIWRRPRIQTSGPQDFPARAALELILHAHDVCSGLGVEFQPPQDLCDRLREHTRSWPHWSSPGWSPPTTAGDAWADLLHSSGRTIGTSGVS